MKMQTGKQKQSNKGFTLVEVLVAILVLSIVIVPLLSAFVVSANTNAKARQTLRATTIAQNVMEELKAYSLESSAAQYNGMASGNSVIAKAANAYETVLRADNVHKQVTIENGVVTDRAIERYDFVLEGVAQESAKFDVEIQIRKPVSGSGAYAMANITSMNRSDCAYYAQENSAHNIVGSEYARRRQNYVNNYDMSAAAFVEIMTRTITIDINSAADGSETVKVTYDYLIDSGYVTEDNRHYIEYSAIFDNYASGEELKAVYVYYYPLYSNTSARDSFVINNAGDLPVDVYLIRMNDQTAGIFETANYKPTVDVNETNMGVDGKSNAKICTNITLSNLITKYNGVGTSTKIKTADLGNAETVQNMYDVTIKVYQHDAGAFDTSSGSTLITFNENKKISTFTGTVLEKAD